VRVAAIAVVLGGAAVTAVGARTTMSAATRSRAARVGVERKIRERTAP